MSVGWSGEEVFPLFTSEGHLTWRHIGEDEIADLGEPGDLITVISLKREIK